MALYGLVFHRLLLGQGMLAVWAILAGCMFRRGGQA